MKTAAETILKALEPGELFTDDLQIMKEEYTRLARIWHPDVNDNSETAHKVMTRINTLFHQGLELIRRGRWSKPGYLKLRSLDGKIHELTYRRSLDFELGTMYIGERAVLYLLTEANRAFYENGVRALEGLGFADDRMRKEVARYLPQGLGRFETVDHCWGLVVGKTPDVLLLKDVLRYYEGRVDVRHTAWILSSLYNLACYLDYSRLAHNAITMDSYFISLQQHNGALLGGWWYATPQGGRMAGVPEQIYSVLPPRVREEKRGDVQTDLEAIRLIGRELLGDRTGSRLAESGEVPEALLHWLRSAPAESAWEEYSRWKSVLERSFGARRFVEMRLTAAELYGKLNRNDFKGGWV